MTSPTSLAGELDRFVAARLRMHARMFNDLGAELAAAVTPDPERRTVNAGAQALRRYVGDRALVEASSLLDGDRSELATFRESLVHRLGLAAVGLVLDAAETPQQQPQDASPEAAFDVLERAYALVAS